MAPCLDRLFVGLALVGVTASTVFFEENFDTFDEKKWAHSNFKPGHMGHFIHSAGRWHADAQLNRGMATDVGIKHYVTSSKIDPPFSNRGRDLVIQFSVKNELNQYGFCGGGYIKLHPAGLKQATLSGKSKYYVMFGPDICLFEHSRISAVLRDPEGQKLQKESQVKINEDERDEFTHLYTWVIKADRSYKIYRDMALRSKGQIWKQWDFEPPYFDEETPDDWVTRQTIIDPEDTKPGDWDQPKMIEDPEDTKPVYVYENEEEDEYAAEEGEEEWQPRLIDNPEYKGVWQQQRIPNPAYKGPFKPDKIENEDFVEDHAVYDDIGLVGFELWVVHNATIFDNILICDDVEYAKAQGEHVWRKHRDAEKHAKFKWEAANPKDEL